MAGLKYTKRMRIIPVVDDPVQQRGVAALRYAGEEDAADHVTTIADSRFSQERPRTVQCVRQLEENRTHGLMSVQNFGEQESLSASYVHERLDASEVVGGHDGAGFGEAQRRHGLVHDRRDVRPARHVLEERRAEHMIE